MMSHDEIDLFSAGQAALGEARWGDAADLLRKGVADHQTPEVLDGLARAVWWLGEVEEALSFREQAYSGYKEQGDTERAVKIALWLSVEYHSAMGKTAIANGWLERAASLLADQPISTAHGWLALTQAGRAMDFSQKEMLATKALVLARQGDDADLEVRALARLALAMVAAGQVEHGMARFDEAMVAATAESRVMLETIGETYCAGFAMLEIIGDTSRLEQWSAQIMRFMSRHEYGPLLAFCGACCGELLAASGDMEGAERELKRALERLQATSGRARCVHPAAKLADLRLMQGRVEEAARLIADYQGKPEVARAEAAIALASGRPEAAILLLERQLMSLGNDGLFAVPFLVALVDAHLAASDPLAGQESADRLQAIAMTSGLPGTRASALRAAGQIASARGDAKATALFEESLDLFVKQGMPLEVARVRLLIAQEMSKQDPQLAAEEARNAMAAFERLGARNEADAAAALLRGLGVPGPPGPKDGETLTRREKEVLALLGVGLTNREIAGRLYISVKTVDHHVSRILGKLNLRNRSEAAAYSLRQAT
jgi:DNA-binding NarL/FixJ family response regulator